MTWTLTTGRKRDGRYWARLENDTHYAVGEGADEWEAALNATHEAMPLFDAASATSQPVPAT